LVSGSYYKPISEFSEEELWETRDGDLIPIVYLSDRHLENCIEVLQEIVNRSMDEAGYRYNADHALLDVEEQERKLHLLKEESKRRKVEGIKVGEAVNPYYMEMRRK